MWQWLAHLLLLAEGYRCSYYRPTFAQLKGDIYLLISRQIPPDSNVLTNHLTLAITQLHPATAATVGKSGELSSFTLDRHITNTALKAVGSAYLLLLVGNSPDCSASLTALAAR